MYIRFRFLVAQEIPPYQTRSVMRASFTGRVESNHTAFIRIKTNHSATLGVEGGEFLMLPVEVEVSSGKALFSFFFLFMYLVFLHCFYLIIYILG